MGRRKNQTARRTQLVDAAQRVIVQRGLTGLRIKDVAEEAGLSPGLVSYYYPDLDDLLAEVHQGALERFYYKRLQAVAEVADPAQRLVTTICSGLPSGRDDLTCRVLYEMHVHGGRSSLHATLMRSLFEREVSLYLSILETGAGLGRFALSEPALSVARNLVALEDAYGLHIIGRNSAIDVETARQLLLSFARAATGCALPSPEVV